MALITDHARVLVAPAADAAAAAPSLLEGLGLYHLFSSMLLLACVDARVQCCADAVHGHAQGLQ